MEIVERLQRLHEHVQEHPADYQAVVAELKMRSDLLQKEEHDRFCARLKRVAEIRKRRRDYEEQNE